MKRLWTCRKTDYGIKRLWTCRKTDYGMKRLWTCRKTNYGMKRLWTCRKTDYGMKRLWTCRKTDYGMKSLWTCRKTDYGMNEWMNVMPFSDRQYHDNFSISLVNRVVDGQISRDAPTNCSRRTVWKVLLWGKNVIRLQGITLTPALSLTLVTSLCRSL
jgi:hypothetical protein